MFDCSETVIVLYIQDLVNYSTIRKHDKLENTFVSNYKSLRDRIHGVSGTFLNTVTPVIHLKSLLKSSLSESKESYLTDLWH